MYKKIIKIKLYILNILLIFNCSSFNVKNAKLKVSSKELKVNDWIEQLKYYDHKAIGKKIEKLKLIIEGYNTKSIKNLIPKTVLKLINEYLIDTVLFRLIQKDKISTFDIDFNLISNIPLNKKFFYSLPEDIKILKNRNICAIFGKNVLYHITTNKLKPIKKYNYDIEIHMGSILIEQKGNFYLFIRYMNSIGKKKHIILNLMNGEEIDFNFSLNFRVSKNSNEFISYNHISTLEEVWKEIIFLKTKFISTKNYLINNDKCEVTSKISGEKFKIKLCNPVSVFDYEKDQVFLTYRPRFSKKFFNIITLLDTKLILEELKIHPLGLKAFKLIHPSQVISVDYKYLKYWTIENKKLRVLYKKEIDTTEDLYVI